MVEQSGSIPRSFIESLLARADVVQVINQRVPLKKAGTSYKACCPFHDEKTPSFNVSSTKQFYHCFGCGASGDALKFLMDYDGLSFVEAVESLAAQYGMPVPREQLSPAQQKSQQQKQQKQRDLYDVMHLAAKYYRMQLRDHPDSEQAKAYLRQRGLSPEIAKEFVIGFAPPGWDSLQTGLKADAKLKQQLIEVGMLVEKDANRSYDRFRNRIMFPIRDGRGRVIAFGGRVLTSEEQPKYLNSPETPIFHKSYTLYGLYEMRQSRQKFDHILVVEGYMDVVALAQYGIRNAVATLGTATTAEHLDILFRQVNEVVFCFDGDQAGLKAAWKALDLALPLMEKERSVKFLFLAEGEDPDSTVRKEGVAGFNQRVLNALSLSEFLLQGLQGKLSFPVNSIEGRQQLVALAEPYVQSAQGLYQFLLAEGVAHIVGLPTWRVEKQMNVRSGFAQSNSGYKNQKQQAGTEAQNAIKVVTIALKMVRLLLRRPHWAEFFSEEILKDLVNSVNRDYVVLGVFVKQLQTNQYDAQFALNAVAQNGYGEEIALVEQSELPNDEAFLLAEFEMAIAAILTQLDEQNLGRSGWGDAELKRLIALAKNR
ncbi:DNA primase [Thiomicrorhabdus sediminis]|uniref:DNA primase n=1 Tax=Thiomicrorhabdus sediminis TaxID=2580412 RepID=A0A4P9K8S3_9GAMM|nr:DNA primase [Thiomicrorhabdus sediminis]QCU90816.1 DNA primase [Thiomicrorhabdus sediminis]